MYEGGGRESDVVPPTGKTERAGPRKSRGDCAETARGKGTVASIQSVNGRAAIGADLLDSVSMLLKLTLKLLKLRSALELLNNVAIEED